MLLKIFVQNDRQERVFNTVHNAKSLKELDRSNCDEMNYDSPQLQLFVIRTPAKNNNNNSNNNNNNNNNNSGINICVSHQ